MKKNPESPQQTPTLRHEGVTTDQRHLSDDDCEDQACTPISYGCRLHPTFRRGENKPRYSRLVKRGGFWVCPKCDAGYGPVERGRA